MEKNLTSGSVFRNMLRFALPYLFSSFLQTLYGMADLFIIGRFGGVDAITAVSVGSQVMHMLTVMIVGLAMGSTVTIGQEVGAGRSRKVCEAVGNTVILFMAVAAAVTVALLACVRPVVALIATPAEAVSGAVAYLTVCFAGIPFITAYNILSSVYRGLGDSKSPMYFIAVACVINIVLDYLFIGVWHLGPMGAALGTTLSQAVSVVTALAAMRGQKTGMVFKREHFRPQKRVMAKMLGIGIPVAMQDGFIQIAFLVITVIANRRGLHDAAAVGIVEKMIGVVFLVPSAMLSAVSALCAQNIGADRHDRAEQTLRYALALTFFYGLAVSLLIQICAGQAVGLFTQDEAAILLGSQYIRGYIWDCIFAGAHFCFSGYFCAYGMSGISFLHNFCSIVLVRVPGAYLASRFFADTLFPMGLAAPGGSLLSVLICVAAFIWMRRRMGKNKIPVEDVGAGTF